jgi:hypothetical protein
MLSLPFPHCLFGTWSLSPLGPAGIAVKNDHDAHCLLLIPDVSVRAGSVGSHLQSLPDLILALSSAASPLPQPAADLAPEPDLDVPDAVSSTMQMALTASTRYSLGEHFLISYQPNGKDLVLSYTYNFHRGKPEAIYVRCWANSNGWVDLWCSGTRRTLYSSSRLDVERKGAPSALPWPLGDRPVLPVPFPVPTLSIGAWTVTALGRRGFQLKNSSDQHSVLIVSDASSGEATIGKFRQPLSEIINLLHGTISVQPPVRDPLPSFAPAQPQPRKKMSPTSRHRNPHIDPNLMFSGLFAPPMVMRRLNKQATLVFSAQLALQICKGAFTVTWRSAPAGTFLHLHAALNSALVSASSAGHTACFLFPKPLPPGSDADTSWFDDSAPSSVAVSALSSFHATIGLWRFSLNDGTFAVHFKPTGDPLVRAPLFSPSEPLFLSPPLGPSAVCARLRSPPPPVCPQHPILEAPAAACVNFSFSDTVHLTVFPRGWALSLSFAPGPSGPAPFSDIRVYAPIHRASPVLLIAGRAGTLFERRGELVFQKVSAEPFLPEAPEQLISVLPTQRLHLPIGDFWSLSAEAGVLSILGLPSQPITILTATPLLSPSVCGLSVPALVEMFKTKSGFSFFKRSSA